MNVPQGDMPLARQRQGRGRPAITCTLLWLLTLCLLPFAADAADEVHRRTGILAVCSPFSPLIAVDLRESDQGGFLVGRIEAKSVLLRGDRPVGLQEFTVGETVRVTWQKSAAGIRIMTLLAPGAISPPKVAPRRPLLRGPHDIGAVLGSNRRHRVRKNDTLLDIARRYDLGFNEMAALYPAFDPWLPPVGEVLDIPGMRLLPDAPFEGIVINVPEMRLFAFAGGKGDLVVRTHPIGIGDTDFPTPTGLFRVGARSVHPTWHVPPSLRGKYRQASFPPGPDNPLGDYWIGLADTLYGIHGTDMPWAVGRLVTRGCIRMYPEDIETFYPTVASGTRVRMIYQPVKVALVSGRLLIEVHGDVYSRLDNLAVYGLNLIGRLGLASRLDQRQFVQAVMHQDGMVRDITRKKDDMTATADRE